MIAQARANVALNRIENVEFECRDLYGAELAGWRPGSFSHLLLDPPRSGALEVVKSLVPELIPLKIAYVSCNPATLARDAAILVEHGYQVDSVQIVDMFPQTAHIESLLLLGRK
jgi:23S rRNA (uracil1939-C5)-methyltransferase